MKKDSKHIINFSLGIAYIKLKKVKRISDLNVLKLLFFQKATEKIKAETKGQI